ncbi:MAG: pyridoxal-phosphate dependent enzyme [bacterium]
MKPMTAQSLEALLARFPRARLAHTPTPLEPLLLTPLPDALARCAWSVKRDDCTGLAMGGNKARQLEFYLGAALAEGCDAVLSTGAVQSNYMRMLAAGAAKLGMECHIQLEARVDNRSRAYRTSGNVLLDRLLGARLHSYALGEDEDGADRALAEIAQRLAAAGKRPYIIPLGAGHAPLGALGYVAAAIELARQIDAARAPVDLIALGSGSGLTHAGLLVGLRLLGCDIPVLGACVRRDAAAQRARVTRRCADLIELLGAPDALGDEAIWVDDSALAPGYGEAAPQVREDLKWLAAGAGLLTDPVYSAKTFSCVFNLIRAGAEHRHIVVVHTGGTPALFAYGEASWSSDAPNGSGCDVVL